MQGETAARAIDVVIVAALFAMQAALALGAVPLPV